MRLRRMPAATRKAKRLELECGDLEVAGSVTGLSKVESGSRKEGSSVRGFCADWPSHVSADCELKIAYQRLGDGSELAECAMKLLWAMTAVGTSLLSAV
jgi:hypothetical protein